MNIMSKPTLHEVKEYFKNAKEVICNEHKILIEIFEIDTTSIRYLNKYSSQIVCNSIENDTAYVSLFHNGKYAEIISYKEPLYQLTAKEIVHAYENPQYLKDTFKECFETELEVNRWYKMDCNQSLFYITKLGKKYVSAYGFNQFGEWVNEIDNFGLNQSYNKIPATEKEVEEALVKEAIKRGYKKGTKVTSVMSKNERVCKDDIYYNSFESNQLLFGHECCIFMDGVWSEITPVPTYTIQEAEEKFNIKIKAV